MAICKICDKFDTCKKNKNNNTRNCKLFIPSKEKELQHLKDMEKKELHCLRQLKQLNEDIKNHNYYNY